MRPSAFLLSVVLVSTCALAAAGPPELAAAAPGKAIPFDQLGAETQKRCTGDDIGITASATGAHLRAVMQDLEADATAGGLWLTSTADEDSGLTNRFRVRAVAALRTDTFGTGGGLALPFANSGRVAVTKDAAIWVRAGVIEEYTVSTDGVRQDFVLTDPPPGASGDLTVELEVIGARAETAEYGAKLTVDATGRELAYSRLRVTDATGRELTARMEVPSPDRLRVVVEDAGAAYPVRIDPTFSDADWVALNAQGLPGATGPVFALATDGNGNLFAGGQFRCIGTVATVGVARWNGSVWSALGSGVNDTVSALAVMGNDLYAGGSFTTAGGVPVNRIAKWDGSAWSALGTGMNKIVHVLEVSGGTVYAGGDFTTAGGAPANRIAAWDGSTWSALGSGMDAYVTALAADAGGHLFVGGYFLTAGTTFTPFMAQANLTGTPAGLAAWQAAHFTLPGEAALAAADADPDNDGVVNLIEYAVKSPPKTAGPVPGVASAGGGALQLVFDVRDDDPALGAFAQSGAALSSFAGNIAPVSTDPVPGDGLKRWTFTDQPPAGVSPRRFLRAVFSLN